jgi:hypothetical protein
VQQYAREKEVMGLTYPSVVDAPLSAVLPWRHTHQFAPAGQQATRVIEVVETPLSARVLRPMFAFQHRQLADDLAAQARARELCPGPLTIAVTGSGGLIDTALTALLTTAGHHFRYPQLKAALRHVLGRDPAVIPAIRVPADAE